MAYTTIDNPELYFQAKNYNGTGSSQAFTLDGTENMQPDWTWIKQRNGTASHILTDSVRGVTKHLVGNTNAAEVTSSAYITSFDTDGFTLADDGDVNGSGRTYASWNWKAGTSFSNSSGSNGANLDSSGSVSTTAGFSIVSFTGNRSTTRNIYHGLGAVPKMIIFKNRSATNGWTIYNNKIGNAKKLTLNSNTAEGNCTACFASTDPTSTLFSVGDDGDTNGTSENMIAYCFADVQGYSRFGSYTGNGSTNGIFVYTGFKPAFVLTKCVDTARNWNIRDNKLNPRNVTESFLEGNGTTAVQTDVGYSSMDLLSNGFKHRGVGGDTNVSGDEYIYMAFAESPFVTGASAIPTTAR